jgi:hypothetical protein
VKEGRLGDGVELHLSMVTDFGKNRERYLVAECIARKPPSTGSWLHLTNPAVLARAQTPAAPG